MARKPGKGRRKLPMTRIENPSRRDVTFSKRKGGLFKKADEITTLTGAEVGLFVFSPAGKVYSYGSPDVDTIAERVMMGIGGSGSGAAPSRSVTALNERLTQIEGQLAAEKKIGEELGRMGRAAEEENRRTWWRPEYPGPLGMAELERLRESAEELKRQVATQAEKVLVVEAAGPSSAEIEAVAALNSLCYGNFDPYAAGSSSVNPPLHIDGANPNVAGPSTAVPPFIGGVNPNAAGPSSMAPNMYGGGGYGYGPQGPF